MSIDVDKASIEWETARCRPLFETIGYQGVYVNFWYSSGDDTVEGTIKSVVSNDSKYPAYTVGFDGNPDHVWEIFDYAVAETIRQGRFNLARCYIIFYYRPVNRMAVIRDCFPDWLDENGELLPDYAD